MRARTSVAAVAVVAAAAALGSGCGGKDETARVRGPAQQAANVVESLQRALAARDYERICTDLFSTEVRQQAGGSGCPAFLRRTAGSVKRPRIQVTDIQLSGDKAKVRVVTSAVGQARVAETLELVREDGRFRIAALSG